MMVNQTHFCIMISTETPYKLADIIRDTWPGLYRPPKRVYNEKPSSKKNA